MIIVFCLIMIPRLDIMKVMATEVKMKIIRHDFTWDGAVFQNLKKFNFKILPKSNKYMKFSMETRIPRKPGASRNNGRNQKVKIFSGILYPAILTPEDAVLKSADLF